MKTRAELAIGLLGHASDVLAGDVNRKATAKGLSILAEHAVPEAGEDKADPVVAGLVLCARRVVEMSERDGELAAAFMLRALSHAVQARKETAAGRPGIDVLRAVLADAALVTLDPAAEDPVEEYCEALTTDADGAALFPANRLAAELADGDAPPPENGRAHLALAAIARLLRPDLVGEDDVRRAMLTAEALERVQDDPEDPGAAAVGSARFECQEEAVDALLREYLAAFPAPEMSAWPKAVEAVEAEAEAEAQDADALADAEEAVADAEAVLAEAEAELEAARTPEPPKTVEEVSVENPGLLVVDPAEGAEKRYLVGGLRYRHRAAAEEALAAARTEAE